MALTWAWYEVTVGSLLLVILLGDLLFTLITVMRKLLIALLSARESGMIKLRNSLLWYVT